MDFLGAVPPKFEKLRGPHKPFVPRVIDISSLLTVSTYNVVFHSDFVKSESQMIKTFFIRSNPKHGLSLNFKASFLSAFSLDSCV